MISSLRGRLLHKDTQGAIVECGGVGYGVQMSLSSLARLGAQGGEVQIFVHTHLSQDSLRLFGFMDVVERQTFETLIAASGVGPRLALAILSTLSPSELAAVVGRGDKATLTRIPGVGPKKAERLLLELKDRLAHIVPAERGPVAHEAVLQDLASALVNLGFKPVIAEQVGRQVLEAHAAETDLATLVRAALRASTRV